MIKIVEAAMSSSMSFQDVATITLAESELRPFFRDGKVTVTCKVKFNVKPPKPTVTCDVEFEIPDPQAPTIPQLYQICSNPTNYTLEVGSKKLEVHRECLMLVSPVFHAMLSSGKSKSRKMKIPNLEYDAVKAAIDFCYGRELHDKSTETYLGILRFAKKYKIDAVAAEVERFLTLNLSVDSVSSLMRYEFCLDKCIQFFKENKAEVKKTEKFVKLPPAIVIRVLKAAFELKTDFELLQYAHSHDYEFIIDELEKRVLTSITLDNFGPIVSYAWDNNRDDLKKACAKFCTQNHADIVKLNSFISLSAGTIGGVIKLAFGVKQEMP